MLELEYVENNQTDSLYDIIEVGYKILKDKIKGSKTTTTFNAKDRKMILNFLQMLQNNYGLESVGENFLYNYFIFQLDYWSNLETHFNNTISLGWIIGKKALLRFEQRRDKNLYHSHVTARKLGVTKDMFFYSKENSDVVNLSTKEEVAKEKYYNSGRGLGECLESTTLYNHKSPFCVGCKFKSDCKAILKSEYTKIFILRGYLKHEKNRNKQ